MTDQEQLGDPVTIAYIHANEVAYSWHHSMVELVGYDLANHGRIMQGGYVAIRCGSGQLAEARNKAVRNFLDEGKADWLFWIDTDMGFAPDVIDELFDAADPDERPIVGGLCFIQTEREEDGMGGWHTHATPTIFDWAKIDKDGQEQMGFAVRWGFPPNTVVQCSGTGMACVLIHRSVFEKIEAAHGRVWYDRVPNTSTGQILGEDLSFCLRAGALGVPINVHTGVWTTHLKSAWVSVQDYVRQRAADAPAAPTPATGETAVVVPALRATNADRFMSSLRATTGLATVYAIANPDEQDAITLWKQAGAEIIVGDVMSFAERMNLGYRETSEPWLFLTGDDVQFHPGWLDHAQALAGGERHVVGTNDLGNPRVTSGEHATHLLVRRSYVDEVGASWDGPKVVAHEGYHHWYVDDEIVSAAKQRGVWAMASASVVEHLHPAWGKADMDEVYRLGQSHAADDQRLHLTRVKEHAE